MTASQQFELTFWAAVLKNPELTVATVKAQRAEYVRLRRGVSADAKASKLMAGMARSFYRPIPAEYVAKCEAEVVVAEAKRNAYTDSIKQIDRLLEEYDEMERFPF